jgi:hypothetical protein
MYEALRLGAVLFFLRCSFEDISQDSNNSRYGKGNNSGHSPELQSVINHSGYYQADTNQYEYNKKQNAG